MRRFDEAYREVMNSRMFYESAAGKSVVIQVSNKNFYASVVRFIDDGNSYDVIFDEYSIVNEYHEDCKLQKRLCSIIYETDNFSQIMFSQIFSCISNKLKSKYSLKIENDFPVYIFKIDFKDPKIVYRMFKSFGIECDSDNLDMTIKEKVKYENDLFTKNLGGSLGLYFNAGNCKMLFLNINSEDYFNESIINHEVYHLLQDVFNVHINLKPPTFQGIPELQLSKADLAYLYRDDEFEVHIKVDLVDQLEEAYWRHFKDISRNAFVIKFIYQTQCSPTSIYDNEIIRKIISSEMKHSDLTSIRLFYSTFLMSDSSWSSLAVKWLKEAFK